MDRKLDLPTPRSNDLFKLTDGTDATISIYSIEERAIHPTRGGKYPDCKGEGCNLCGMGRPQKAWYYADAEVDGRRTLLSMGPLLYKQVHAYLMTQEDQQAPFRIRQSGRELRARWMIVPADAEAKVNADSNTKLDTKAEAEVEALIDTDTVTFRAVGSPAQQVAENDPFGTILLGSVGGADHSRLAGDGSLRRSRSG